RRVTWLVRLRHRRRSVSPWLLRFLFAARDATVRHCLSLHDALPISRAGRQAPPAAGRLHGGARPAVRLLHAGHADDRLRLPRQADRKSTRLNSSHEWISYAVFCSKKKTHSEPPPKSHTTNHEPDTTP